MAKAANFGLISISVLLTFSSLASVSAAPQFRLSVAAGARGAPEFLIGSAIAQLISQNIPGVEATAEVTAGPADNMRLIGAKRAQLGQTGSVVARDAFLGEGEVAGNPIPVRTLVPLFNMYVHLVTVEGTGVSTIGDLRGKRVSVGLPGSAIERNVLRILKAAGIEQDRDIRKEGLSLAESVAALRDRRVDAFFWAAGLPIPAVLDLGITPGVRLKLIPLTQVLPTLQKEFGNRYVPLTIQKEFYPGTPTDVPTIGTTYLLVAHQDVSAQLAYQITRLIFERRAELAKTFSQAQFITLIGVAGRSSIPFHPGAIRYFKERGVEGF